jgi:hypothetical protein
VAELLMEIEGVGSVIRLYDDRVGIRRKGFLGISAHGSDGEKEIWLQSLTGVQFKDPNMWTNGYIQFIFPGSQENKRGAFAAASDENTVMFKKAQENDFITLKLQIDDLLQTIRERHYAPQASISVADELEKLASLRDRGIITDSQFEVQRDRLLA